MVWGEPVEEFTAEGSNGEEPAARTGDISNNRAMNRYRKIPAVFRESYHILGYFPG
jgi:hypothetical protein